MCTCAENVMYLCVYLYILQKNSIDSLYRLSLEAPDLHDLHVMQKLQMRTSFLRMCKDEKCLGGSSN